MIVEFETHLDDNIIHLPEAVAAQLKNGLAVHVSIRPVDSETRSKNSADAWDAFFKVTTDRHLLHDESKRYEWKREDAYEHLK